jgi:hypothetical protein
MLDRCAGQGSVHLRGKEAGKTYSLPIGSYLVYAPRDTVGDT